MTGRNLKYNIPEADASFNQYEIEPDKRLLQHLICFYQLLDNFANPKIHTTKMY